MLTIETVAHNCHINARHLAKKLGVSEQEIGVSIFKLDKSVLKNLQVFAKRVNYQDKPHILRVTDELTGDFAYWFSHDFSSTKRKFPFLGAVKPFLGE